jgi:type IV pilus assembly protein PilB
MEAEDSLAEKKLKIKPMLIGPTDMEKLWTHLYGPDSERDGNLMRKGMDKLQTDIEKKGGTMMLTKKDYSKVEGKEDEKVDEAKMKESLEIKDFDALVTGAIGDLEVVQTKDIQSQYMLSMQADAAPVIKMVNGIIIKAVEMGASDIHVEPFEKQLRVRFRIDGSLHEVMTLPPGVKNAVTSRLKVMSDMDIAERRIPQDGRIKIQLGRKQVDLRVNTLPSLFGEKTVIRILGQSSLGKDVAAIGFSVKATTDIIRAMNSPYGMILVTGPTGSGKSTTLYTMLNQLNLPDTNIVTAEDPDRKSVV